MNQVEGGGEGIQGKGQGRREGRREQKEGAEGA